MKASLFLLMVSLFLASAVISTLEIRPARAATIFVPDDYSSIQNAVNAAIEGARAIAIAELFWKVR